MDSAPHGYWDAVPVELNSLLISLHDCILGGDKPPRRTPKWRFKCAPDLAVEIQPKDYGYSLVLFEGRVLEGDDITVESFKARRADSRELKGMHFRILDGCDKGWLFEPRSRMANAHHLKARTVLALSEIFPGRMVLLSPSCLICGKGLSDPVSKARLIGPECAGRSSVVVSLRLMEIDEPRTQAAAAD